MQSDKNNSIPIVNNSRAEYGNGILTERQKKWVNAHNYEANVENPVFYKYQQNLKKADVPSEAHQNSLLVRGLILENEEESKSSVGILEKIQEARRARHNSAYEDMMQALEAVSLTIEPKVEKICSKCKQLLDNNCIVIQKTIDEISDENILVTLSSAQLQSIWMDLENHMAAREQWINEMYNGLIELEEERKRQIGRVLHEYMQILCRIAHLMSPDVQRLLQVDILNANTSILSNRKSYAELKRKLLTGEVERENKLHYQWTVCYDNWKSLKLKEAVDNFKLFTQQESLCKSPLIKQHLHILIEQQAILNKKRFNLLAQLLDMKPPSATKASVNQWNVALSQLTDKIDRLQQEFMSFLHVEHQNILNQCHREMTRIKTTLFEEGAVTEDFLKELTEDEFLPLLDGKKSAFENEEELIQKQFEEVSALQKENFRILFQHAQGASHLWDSHMLGLSKEEKNLQEMLDKCRRDHDYENQLKETRLDIVIDRMRQESHEEGLATDLKVALSMMEEIKKSYYMFREQQKEITKKYPDMVSEELHRYDASLHKYFQFENNEKNSCEVVDNMAEVKKTLSQLSLAKGDCLDESLSSQSSLIIEDAPTEEQLYIKSQLIPSSLMQQLFNSIQTNFMEHFKSWLQDAKKRAIESKNAKNEEIDNELDLRLHLHKPRSEHATRDVHNVRKAELTLHRERVEQHCVGLTESLATLKTTYEKMTIEHTTMKENFLGTIDKLQESFVVASSTQELKKLQYDVNNSMGNYLDSIRQSVREFRSNLDETLAQLRYSNANFRKAFKLFSEGGTFSPDEVEEYRKILEKYSAKIDQCESQIIGELEGLETKLIDGAKEYTGKLEDKFKHHLFDLTFIEKIKRWLSNIQMKIKTEVANSNSESEKLSKMISVFTKRVNLLSKGEVEDENQKVMSTKEVLSTLEPLIVAFDDRLVFLDCASKKECLSFFSLQENIVSAEKSKDKKTNLKKTSKTISGKGRILQTSNQQSVFSPSRSPLSQTSEESTDEPIASENNGKPLIRGVRQPSGQRLSTYHGGKYDQRYEVFGEFSADQNEKGMIFPMLILRILQNGLDGLLSSAELYYRQKGQRSSTRSRIISETFEGFAEAHIVKLRKYQKQASTYQNSCVQEFRSQIKMFLSSAEHLPRLVMKSTVDEENDSLRRCEVDTQDAFEQERESSEILKAKHQTLLRPTLGHPSNKKELKKLKTAEEDRQKSLLKRIDEFCTSIRNFEINFLKNVVSSLQQKTVELLASFDKLLTLDDVIEGEPLVKQKTEKELIKAKIYGNKNVDDTPTNETAKRETTWGSVKLDSCEWLPDFDLSCELLDIVKPITCSKTTKLHEITINARNVQIQATIKSSVERMKTTESFCNQLWKEEEVWKSRWNVSLDKILHLHS